MTETSETPSLNPHFGQVIGFVGPRGELLEERADAQFNLLINVGEEDEVKVNERVLVFALGRQIIDPETGRDLGCFEVVRGEGRVKSVQARMAVITATEKKTETRSKSFNTLAAIAAGLSAEYETVSVPAPFKDPQLGDRVRFI